MRHLLSVSVTILVLGAASFMPQAFAQLNPLGTDATVPQPRGPFMIAGGNQTMIWRVDQATGLVSYCIRDTVSNDPGLISQRPPICSAWGR